MNRVFVSLAISSALLFAGCGGGKKQTASSDGSGSGGPRWGFVDPGDAAADHQPSKSGKLPATADHAVAATEALADYHVVAMSPAN